MNILLCVSLYTKYRILPGSITKNWISGLKCITYNCIIWHQIPFYSSSTNLYSFQWPEFYLLYILNNTWCCLNFNFCQTNGCEMVAHSFNFQFTQRVMKWRILLCVYWPFAFPWLWVSYSWILYIFLLVFFFCHWFIGVLTYSGY